MNETPFMFYDSNFISKRFVKDKDVSIANYTKYMLDKTQSIFKYNGLPDTIPKRMLELYLQMNGYVGIFKHEGKLYCAFGGMGAVPDAYYRPTQFILANPYLRLTKTFNIAYETNIDEANPNNYCVIIPNDTMYLGMLPMYYKYASLLTENDITMRIADINLRLTSLISAGDDKTRNTALEFLKEIEKGNLGVLADNSFLESLKVIPATAASFSNYMSQLIEYEQYLKASWFHDVGLNSNYNMKREALNSSETNMNEDVLLPFIDNMMEERKLGLERVKKLFDVDITVEFNSSWENVQEKVEVGLEELDNDETVEDEQETKEVEEDDKDESDNT